MLAAIQCAQRAVERVEVEQAAEEQAAEEQAVGRAVEQAEQLLVLRCCLMRCVRPQYLAT